MPHKHQFSKLYYILRPVVPGGAGGDMAPQILADQLSLYQPGEGGADYAHQIILALPDFQTFLRPCVIFCTIFWNTNLVWDISILKKKDGRM